MTPQQRIDALRFTCSCCNADQRGLMDLVKKLPDPIFLIPENERAQRTKIGSDLCVLDSEHFFVRAVLYLPIREADDCFCFGVWGTLAQNNFDTYYAEFENRQPEFGPFFSWLCSSLPPYDSWGLASDMIFLPGNRRPVIQLHEADHPLVAAQRDGISLEEVKQIYAAWGHDVTI
jgi:hypothetical protein